MDLDYQTMKLYLVQLFLILGLTTYRIDATSGKDIYINFSDPSHIPRTAIDESDNHDNADGFGSATPFINRKYDLIQYVWEGVKPTGDTKSHFSKRKDQYVYWGVASAINPEHQDLASAFLKSAEAYNFKREIFSDDVSDLLKSMENVNCKTIAIALLRFNIIDGSYRALYCGHPNPIYSPRWKKGFSEEVANFNFKKNLKWPNLNDFVQKSAKLESGQIIITSMDLDVTSPQKMRLIIEKIEHYKNEDDFYSQNKKLAEELAKILKTELKKEEVTVMVNSVMPRGFDGQGVRNECYIDFGDTSHILEYSTYDLIESIWEGVKQTGDRKSHFSKRKDQYVYWGIASAINPDHQDLTLAFLKSAEAYNFKEKRFSDDVANLLESMENFNCEIIDISLLRFNIMDGSFCVLSCKKSKHFRLASWNPDIPTNINSANNREILRKQLIQFQQWMGKLEPGQIVITSTKKDNGYLTRTINDIKNDQTLVDIHSRNQKFAENIGTFLQKTHKIKDITVMVYSVVERDFNEQHPLANFISGVGERHTESSSGSNRDFAPKAVRIQEDNFMRLGKEKEPERPAGEINFMGLHKENEPEGQGVEINTWDLEKQKELERKRKVFDFWALEEEKDRKRQTVIIE